MTMSKAAFAVGFAATVAILVPAGWHFTDADLQSDGKKVRPPQQSFMIDGVKVTLDVDRNLVTTGDKVTAKLVAYSDKPKTVAVDLSVWHSSNYEGERVEEVPTMIDTEKLTLHAAPGGGKAVETTLTLGQHVGHAARTDTFRVYVTKKGSRPKSGEHFWENYDEEGNPQALADAATVTIMGWSHNNLQLSIKPEGKVRTDAPFFVTVRAKNTSKRTLHGLYMNLGTQVGKYGGIEQSDDYEIEQVDDAKKDDDEGSEEYARTIKRGATEVVRFKVTPKKKGAHAITFLASAYSSDDEIGPVVAGAIEAKTFDAKDVSAVAVK